ncbi:MAG: flagellar biosynthetic protein FliP, partial [Bdellovibrionales bacterium]|nr:flagellar biosynthetic protein FliP [Bdellovibrionales bacterium]
MKIFGLKLLPLLCLGLILVSSIRLVAQNAPGSTGAPGVDISVRLGQDGEEADVSVAIQLVVLMTLLSLAPAIVLLMTSFMRIIIVLGFLRNALGLQSIPPTQVLVGMAVFLSFFLMMPVGERIKTEAFEPFQNGEVTSMEALELASKPLSEFMLKQTRAEDLELFLGIAGMPATSVD